MVDRLYEKSKPTIRLWPIVALRIYTGIFFAYAGLGKVMRENFADGLTGFLTSRLDACFAFYRPIIEGVFLPAKDVMALLVAWGELALGVALILGLMTRYAAFAGAFMVMNFWFAKGQGALDGMNHDVVWMMILLVLGFVHAGKIAGFDNALADRFPFLR